MKASMFAGLAFSNTKTAISHSISYPITLKYKIPHGIACSFTLPIILKSVQGLDEVCDDNIKSLFSNFEEAPFQLKISLKNSKYLQIIKIILEMPMIGN